jgi:hypothetical protein
VKRSKWPLLIGALIIGALAGVALAGRPETLPSVVIPASTVAESTTTAPVAVASTSLPAATSTVAESTTSTSSSAATSTTAATDATRTAGVVVVNGSGRAGQASRAADVLLAAGWPPVVTDDARNPLATSRVMAKPGFEEAAKLAADDLGLTVQIEPYANSIATIDDATGDVMVFLGSDVNI